MLDPKYKRRTMILSQAWAKVKLFLVQSHHPTPLAQAPTVKAMASEHRPSVIPEPQQGQGDSDDPG